MRDKKNYCPVCHEPNNGRCEGCELPFNELYMVGWRDTVLGELVEDYKYRSVRSAGDDLAEMLDRTIPCLKGEAVIVPIPTIRRHIRERGFDHTKTVAKKLAKKRGWQVQSLLVRAKNTVQVGADSKQRKEQAKKAFELVGETRKGVTYLLIDDVWTTGASMMAGAELLRKNGAEKVSGAVMVANRMKLFAGDGFGGSGGATFDADGVKDKVDNSKGEN